MNHTDSRFFLFRFVNAVTKLLFSSDASRKANHIPENNHIQWWRTVPFIILHVACFAVIWVGISRVAALLCLATYSLRIFSIGAVYHRYLAHRCYKMNRFWQFIMVFLATTSTQRGPLWWAAHHRHHHQHTDQHDDPHSPVQHSLLFSHMGWFFTEKNFYFDQNKIRDWLKFPELRWLDKYDYVPPLMMVVGLYFFGESLQASNPALQTSGWQCVVWGYVISTVLVFHATVSVNSICHRFGHRRYKTSDNSRNNVLLSLLTFGEGWHNNHHYYPMSVRQGFRWYEIDITYYCLIVLSWFGIVKELKVIPKSLRDRH